MASNVPMLVGEVDHRDRLIRELQDENRDLRAEVSELRREIESVKRDNSRAVDSLRHVLTPLYRALRAVFGEIEAIGGEEDAPAVPTAKAQVWKSYINKLGGLQGKFIEAMLTHGEMTAAQLRVVASCATSSVHPTLSQLNKLGLVRKTAHGRYALKEL